MFAELDMVRLLIDPGEAHKDIVSDYKVSKGDVGTIVDVHVMPVPGYTVEFVRDDKADGPNEGNACALLNLQEHEIELYREHGAE